MSKTVVILGGNFAGLHVAHYILKQKNKDVKVILVSKVPPLLLPLIHTNTHTVSQNSHFYWNLASVRAIVPESGLQESTLLAPLDVALSRYPAESHELLIGAATDTDFAAKTVTVSLPSGDRTIPYDQLVIATGSHAEASGPDPMPWKAAGTYEELVSQLKMIKQKVSAASHIVVAGAGPSGVELAGELAYDNPQRKQRKEVVLLSADADILGGDGIASNARSELKKLGVQIRMSSKVVSATAKEGGKTEVVLAGGETILTDLYLPTMGLVPNTGFVDGKYLNARGQVVVDEMFNVKDAEGVWALGDVVGQPRCGFMITQKQVSFCSSLHGGTAGSGSVLTGVRLVVWLRMSMLC